MRIFGKLAHDWKNASADGYTHAGVYAGICLKYLTKRGEGSPFPTEICSRRNCTRCVIRRRDDGRDRGPGLLRFA